MQIKLVFFFRVKLFSKSSVGNIVEAQDVKIEMQNIPEKNSEETSSDKEKEPNIAPSEAFFIDSEDYELQSIDLKLLPKKINVYCS